MDQSAITRAFLELADTLVDDYDVIQYVQMLTEHCVSLLDVSEAGVVVEAADGQLRSIASSSERMHFVEMIEVQRDDGPCYDCWRSGEPIVEDDLEQAVDRWPRFAPAALKLGFRAVSALPMKLRDERVGALNLFADHRDGLHRPAQVALAQALADMATIGIVHQRRFQARDGLITQLQGALDSRVVLEQAKGFLAEQTGLDIDEAFRLMRDHARRQQRRLHDVAADVVARKLSAAALVAR